MRGVLVEANELTGSLYGIRIETPRGRGGLVQDIVFRDNRMTGVDARGLRIDSADRRPRATGRGADLIRRQPSKPLANSPAIRL